MEKFSSIPLTLSAMGHSPGELTLLLLHQACCLKRGFPDRTVKIPPFNVFPAVRIPLFGDLHTVMTVSKGSSVF